MDGGGGGDAGSTATLSRKTTLNTDDDMEASTTVGQNYVLSLNLVVTRSELNLHFSQDVAEEGRLTRSNLQGRRLSNFADNVQRSYTENYMDHRDEEAIFGTSFMGGDIYSPSRSNQDGTHGGGGGGGNGGGNGNGGGGSKHRESRNVERIPFPGITVIGKATPPSVSEHESSTNYRKRSATIGISMPTLTLSPRVPKMLENTFDEYQKILKLGREHSVFGSSLLAKHVAAQNEAEKKESGHQKDGYAMSTALKPVSTVVLVDITACEFLLKGSSGIKSQGYVKTPATKVLVSSQYGVGPISNTTTVQNVTASFGELNIRISEKVGGRPNSRTPTNAFRGGRDGGGARGGAASGGATPALQATLAGFKLHVKVVLPSSLHARRGESQSNKITAVATLDKVLVMFDFTKYSLIRGFQDSWYDVERFRQWLNATEPAGGTSSRGDTSDSASMAFLNDSSDDDDSSDDGDIGSSKRSKSVSSRSNSRTGTVDSGRAGGGGSTRRTKPSVSAGSTTHSKASSNGSGSSNGHGSAAKKNVIVFIVNVKDVIATSNLDLVLGTTSASARNLVVRGQVHAGTETSGTAAVKLETVRVGDCNEATNGVTITRHAGEWRDDDGEDPNGLIQGELVVDGMLVGLVYAAPKDGISSISSVTPVLRASISIDKVSAIIKTCMQHRHTVVFHLAVSGAKAHVVDKWHPAALEGGGAEQNDVFAPASSGKAAAAARGDADASPSDHSPDERLSSSTDINLGSIVALLTFQSIPTLKKINERLVEVFKSSKAVSTRVGASNAGAGPAGGGVGDDDADGKDESVMQSDSQAPSSKYSQAFASLGKGFGSVNVCGDALTVVGFETHLHESSWWLFNVAEFGADFVYAPRSQVQCLDLHIGPQDGANEDSNPGIELYSMFALDAQEDTPRPGVDMSVEQWRAWCHERKAASILTGDAKRAILVRARRSVLKSTMDISQLKQTTSSEKIVRCIFVAEFPNRIQVTLNAQNLNELKLYIENLLERTSGGGLRLAETPPTSPLRPNRAIVYLLADVGADATASGDGSPSFVFNPRLQPFSSKDSNITVEWILAQVGITNLQKSVLGSIYKTLHVPLAIYVNTVEVGLHDSVYDGVDQVTELKSESSVYVPLKQVKAATSVNAAGPQAARSALLSEHYRTPSHHRPRRKMSTSPSLARKFMAPNSGGTSSTTLEHANRHVTSGSKSSAGSPDSLTPFPAAAGRPLSARSGQSEGSVVYFTPPGSAAGSIESSGSRQSSPHRSLPPLRMSPKESPQMPQRSGSSLRFEGKM